MATRKVEAKIVADTRRFRRSLLISSLRFEQSRWRRVVLRFRLWRVAREDAP